VDAREAFDAVWNPGFSQACACIIEQAHVVVCLCPIDAEVDHVAPLLVAGHDEAGGARGALMDQWS
jgi:hypothetical protein